MTEFPLLKNFLDTKLIQQISDRITAVYPSFAGPDFVAAVDADLHSLELKPRFILIASTLREYLPIEYPVALDILVRILDEQKQGFEPIEDPGFRLLPVPTFVERFGLEHPRESLDAITIITRYTSCESAIRPYIMRYPAQTMERLHEWAQDSNEHMRRLASEGSRPRLPWSPQLTEFIADPTPTLALLEHLKDDPSLYVRRSVANHLNDISKDRPQIVLERMEAWKNGASEERLWLINHALRSLVKKGDKRALAILGFASPTVELSGLTLTPQRLIFGNELTFAFQLHNIGENSQQLMIDYLFHFVKANGKTAPKVFKLKKRALAAGERLFVEKSHSIRPISIRKYYAGRHRLEIQVNGQILAGCDFELVIDGR